jgi:hypothetical protein
MSGSAFDGAPPAKERDPLVKFLLGCAIVVGTLAALVIGGCGIFAWRLMRDETPGRPVEAMLAGDENRYWCFELKPDDAGIVAMVDRLDRVNDEARRRALENTPLKGFPLPRRRADVQQFLPLKLELTVVGEIPKDVAGWAGRATVSRGGLRMRAMMKAMRWMLTRDAAKAEVLDVDGVQVTVLHERKVQAAFASVGNRILLADGVDRLRRLLTAPHDTSAARLAGIPELHEAIRLDGEDGWAFAADTEVAGPRRPLTLQGAVASFDLTADDALLVRLAVPAGDGAGLAELTADEATAIARSFLPPKAAAAIVLDEGSPVLEGGRAWRIDARISGLTSRLSGFLSESPFASPTEPSLPPTSDPRTDTPSEPPHGGNPTPAR